MIIKQSASLVFVSSAMRRISVSGIRAMCPGSRFSYLLQFHPVSYFSPNINYYNLTRSIYKIFDDAFAVLGINGFRMEL